MELKWPLGGVVFVALLVAGSNAQLDVCGVSQLNSRIVGGGKAPPGAWPWHAEVLLLSNFFCSGSLINDQWILTAAVCALGVDPSLLSVRLGVESLEQPSSNMVKRSISNVIVHPSYTPTSLSNNIALLKMSSPVNFNKYISPVCLAKSGSIYEKGSSWITGFGNTGTKDPNPSPGYLREVEVPIVTRSECQKVYLNPISATMLCAGGGNKGICDGDGGSPLVNKNTANKWIQGGVAAFRAANTGCAHSGVPDGYTRVSSFEDWIKSHIVTNQPGFIIWDGPNPGSGSARTSLVSLPLLLLLLSFVL